MKKILFIVVAIFTLTTQNLSAAQNSAMPAIIMYLLDDTNSTDPYAITDTSTSGTAEGDVNNTGVDEDDMVENAEFENTVKILFSESYATITNPLENSGVSITQSNGIVEVNSTTSKVAYEISGSTASGGLKIYSEKKFKLTLDDVSIVNTTAPAINIQSKKRVFVVLEGTNSLTDVSSYSNIPDDEDAKAAFFSEGQLVFSGNGSLSVAGKYKHGIVSDDYIRVRSGTITVSEAVKDGIHTNDYVVIDGGTLNISASSDGIDCSEGYIIINDGIFNLNVADDGIVASYDVDEEDEPDYDITPNVTINGGTFDITTTEGEGIESKGVMTINDGVIEINAVDDGLNAGGIIYINGGKSYVYSSTNDAIDSNTALTITGGIIIAHGSQVPEAGFDADNNTFKITGGTLLGLGGTTTIPTSSVSTQNSVIFDGTSANSILHIESSDKTEALTFYMPSEVSTVLYSSVKLKTGETYSIYSGGSVSNGENFHGLYTSGTYNTTTTSTSSFTIESTVTQIGGESGPGGGGNPGGPGRR